MSFTRSVAAWVHGAQFDVQSLVADLWKFSKGHHKSAISETPGTAKVPTHRFRLAVVAIHPHSKSADFTIINLLDALLANQCFVLVVSSRVLDEEQRASFSTRSHHVIERHNIGRDFGSYKFGLAWFERHGVIAQAQSIILANDSIYYPKSFRRHVAAALTSGSQWSCLFENFDGYYHAQSFFQEFGPKLFNSVVFKKFWREYRPYSSRKHTIANGEVGFSKKMIKAGFRPNAVFSSSRLASSFRKGEVKRGDRDIEFALRHTLTENPMPYLNGQPLVRHQISREARKLLTALNRTAAMRTANADEIAQAVIRKAELQNPTHSIGLLSNVLYDAPLKRDLVFRGNIELAALLSTAKGFSKDEIVAMRDDLVAKGLPQSLAHSFREMTFFNTGRL